MRTKFLVCHLPTTEADGHLRFVTGRQKANQIFELGLIIALFRPGTKFYFLYMYDLLLLSRLVLLLVLLEQVLSIVHNPADRRIGCRRNLDQVEISVVSQIYRLFQRHYAGLGTIGPDNPNFRCGYLIVAAYSFGRGDILLLQSNAAAARDIGLECLDKGLKPDTAEVFAGSRAHGHGIRFCLPVADDQEIRNTL